MKKLVLQLPAGTAAVQVTVRCILLLYGNQDLSRSCEKVFVHANFSTFFTQQFPIIKMSKSQIY